jgi:O-acetyl-ADP-ribose deacetylase (regulator of RNase III)
MMKTVSGNMLQADVEALVNTVNTVGVMGKGIALQFKKAFPENYAAYRRACENGTIEIGKVFVYETGDVHNPKFIVNFPTKTHWRAKSNLTDIEAGLIDLRKQIVEKGIKSIAIPPLGCGNGGLNWTEVLPLIRTRLSQLRNVAIYVYSPDGPPPPSEMTSKVSRPRMTGGRAAILKLLGQYLELGFAASVLEMQKLAYFLQEAGQPLRLRYAKGKFGPFASELAHVLSVLEGHYISGFGDGSGGRHAQLQLMPGAYAEAEAYLERDEVTRKRFDRVRKLIEGFETPYGMELLASVHWVAREDVTAQLDARAAVDAVHAWSIRKRGNFQPDHIVKAWRRLFAQGWVGSN